MQIRTYQTKLVLDILREGTVYRAPRSVNYARAYDSLIEMLRLNCNCPVFGCLKYHRQCADGRGASSVLLEMDVPRDKVWLTEYAVWADFIYYLRFTTPSNFRKIAGVTAEITQSQFDQMIDSLETQKGPWHYKVPQAVLEEIRPEWVKKYRIGPAGNKKQKFIG